MSRAALVGYRDQIAAGEAMLSGEWLPFRAAAKAYGMSRAQLRDAIHAGEIRVRTIVHGVAKLVEAPR